MFLCVYMQVELRKEFQAQEAALQRSLSKLRSELQKAQEEARENRDKTNRLQTSLANAERTIKVCGWWDSSGSDSVLKHTTTYLIVYHDLN